jgi:hypothetical protein
MATGRKLLSAALAGGKKNANWSLMRTVAMGVFFLVNQMRNKREIGPKSK